MKFIRGKEAYYLQAKEIVEQTENFKVLAKTPTLFIPSQQKETYQIAYYNSLISRIRNGDIHIEYMFSLPLTREEILGIGKRNPEEALQALKEWKKYSNHPIIDLRYMKETNPFSCCIGDMATTVLLAYPLGDRAAMTFDNNENPYYSEAFNQLFKTAENKHGDAISEIKIKLSQ